MMLELVPLVVLPGPVTSSVVVACIAMAAVALVVGLRRRESGYDPMLVVSALVVVALAVAILVGR